MQFGANLSVEGRLEKILVSWQIRFFNDRPLSRDHFLSPFVSIAVIPLLLSKSKKGPEISGPALAQGV